MPLIAGNFAMRKDVEGAKVYGICLERLEHQVKNVL